MTLRGFVNYLLLVDYFTPQVHWPAGHFVQAVAPEHWHLEVPQHPELEQLARARAPAPTSRIHNFFIAHYLYMASENIQKFLC